MFTSIPATGTLTTLHTQLLLTSWVSGSCLFPSVMYFQTRQVTIHRKRFLHLLFFACVWCCFFFFCPAALWALQRETSFAMSMLQKGELNAERNVWWKTTGPRQVGGQPDPTASNNQCVCALTPTWGKSFLPSTYVSAYRRMQPSSNKKNTICSEHKFIFNNTTHTFL